MAKEIMLVGNWKMYKTGSEATTFIKELAAKIKDKPLKTYLAVPFTVIAPAVKVAEGTNVVIGAQNMHDAREGAFTGEVAGQMLVEAGAKFVLLGHSERRQIFGETSEFINRKVKSALSNGLQPILCIGETLTEREEGKTKEVLEKQILDSLQGIDKEELERIIFAYEPVWAIGTGRTATPEIAEETHVFCREIIAKHWEGINPQAVIILYGGSVKPDNIKSLIKQPGINGALIGGAALNIGSFLEIINIASNEE